MPNLLTPQEEAMVQAFISDQMTGGVTAGAELDPLWFTEEVPTREERLIRLSSFMLYYFPRDFFSWEPLNEEFFSFVEYCNKGMAWLPAQHGKTTMLWRWFVYVLCAEPDISINYTEKNLPIAQKRSRACRMALEENQRLKHDWGEFRPPPESSKPWSDTQFTIRQRKEMVDSPSVAVYGAGGGSLLGSRCNVLVVDDPVTPENSRSERERDNLLQWFDEAAATSPYPLPIQSDRYLVKQFLIGTVFRRDDLFHQKLATGEYEHLYLKAVDEASGKTLSPRFCYMDRKDLERLAKKSPMHAELLENVRRGVITNLWDYMMVNGRMAFNRRYQNIAVNEDSQWVKEVWLRGGGEGQSDAPPGGWPGCLDKDRASGDVESDWVFVTGCDPQTGSKTRGSKKFAMVTLAASPREPHLFYVVDIENGQYPLMSDNPHRVTQVDLLLRHADKYHSRLVIEENAQQKGWQDVIRAEARKRGRSIQVEGHMTTTNKSDPEVGIQRMGPLFENGYLRLPYKTARDKTRAQWLMDELVYWGVHSTTDLVMALWFAYSRLKKLMQAHDAALAAPVVERSYINRLSNWVFPDDWTNEDRSSWLREQEAADV